MSILVKDIFVAQKPSRITVRFDYADPLESFFHTFHLHPNQIVELPPHGRLIDADKLKKHYEWWKGGTEEHTLDEMLEMFNTIVALQPTIIEAEE